MISVSVKPQYQDVYGGLYFEGELRSHARLLHGAWICEVYLGEDRAAVAFRLGHLEALRDTGEGLDLLRHAEAAGWDGRVATNAGEVTLWTARALAWGMIHVAGQPGAQPGGDLVPGELGAGEWKALEDNLGRPPQAEERAAFRAELRRVLEHPNITNEWPGG